MPKCSKTVHPRTGKVIVFDEDSHVYSLESDPGKKFTSVTTFVESFFPKFDAEKMAPLTARKKGMTTEAVLQMWEDNKLKACSYGTRVHAVCESILTKDPKRMPMPKDPKDDMTFAVAENAASRCLETLEVVGVEKVVFSEKLGLSGTVDFLARDPKTGKYAICDWKTNKAIAKENKYDEFGFGCCSKLPDANYWHYALQLSTYQVLLRYEGYVPKDARFDRRLCHLTPAGYTWIPVPDMSKTVVAMIKESISRR